MAYNVTDNAKLGQLKTGLAAAKTHMDNALASAKSYTDTAEQTAKSYTDTKIAALPTEQFLDQSKTALVSNFTFSAETYSGAADPNLNGKPVLVLALKSVDNVSKAETITYQFISVNELIANKAERAANPTEGHIATLDANGNLVDSGSKFATDEEFNEMLAEVFGTTSNPEGD